MSEVARLSARESRLEEPQRASAAGLAAAEGLAAAPPVSMSTAILRGTLLVERSAASSAPMSLSARLSLPLRRRESCRERCLPAVLLATPRERAPGGASQVLAGLGGMEGRV